MQFYRDGIHIITLQSERTVTLFGNITYKGEAVFWGIRERFDYKKPKHCSPISIVDSYTIKTKDGVRVINAQTEEIALSVCPPNSVIKSVSSFVIDMDECEPKPSEQMQYYRDGQYIITLKTEETATVVGHITDKGSAILWQIRDQFDYEKPRRYSPISVVNTYTIQLEDGVRVINAETEEIALSVCPPKSIIKSIYSFVIDMPECEPKL